jgi:hypothetical protein
MIASHVLALIRAFARHHCATAHTDFRFVRAHLAGVFIAVVIVLFGDLVAHYFGTRWREWARAAVTVTAAG